MKHSHVAETVEDDFGKAIRTEKFPLEIGSGAWIGELFESDCDAGGKRTDRTIIIDISSQLCSTTTPGAIVNNLEDVVSRIETATVTIDTPRRIQ